MTGIAFWRRAQGPTRPRAGRRILVAGFGTSVLGAMVIGAATSSSAGGTHLVPTADEAASVTQVAGIAPLNFNAAAAFAPPKVTGNPMVSPQFRLAAGIPPGPLGIPGVVLQAYKLAATRMASEGPACKLPWFLLAGIGRIESGHAGNGNVDEYGNTRTSILGPALDGTLAGNEVIHDSNGQAARAMGPMQFIPSTWAAWGSDGNGDGKADPNNIFDATYSAGRYLCAGVNDIMAGNNSVNAVFRYNHSTAYVTNVLAWAAAYSTGVMPTQGIPDMHATPVDKPVKPEKPGDKPRKPGDPADPADPRNADPDDTAPETTPKKQKAKKPDCFIVCLPPELGGPQQAPRPAPGPRQSPGAPQNRPDGRSNQPNRQAPLVPLPGAITN